MMFGHWSQKSSCFNQNLPLRPAHFCPCLRSLHANRRNVFFVENSWKLSIFQHWYSTSKMVSNCWTGRWWQLKNVVYFHPENWGKWSNLTCAYCSNGVGGFNQQLSWKKTPKNLRLSDKLLLQLEADAPWIYGSNKNIRKPNPWSEASHWLLFEQDV